MILSRNAEVNVRNIDIILEASDSNSEYIKRIFETREERALKCFPKDKTLNSYEYGLLVIALLLKSPEMGVYYNGWKNLLHWHWEILFTTQLPIYLKLAECYTEGRIALLFHDKNNIESFTEWDKIRTETWVDIIEIYPYLKNKCDKIEKVEEEIQFLRKISKIKFPKNEKFRLIR